MALKTSGFSSGFDIFHCDAYQFFSQAMVSTFITGSHRYGYESFPRLEAALAKSAQESYDVRRL
jgi:hypothetical protein